MEKLASLKRSIMFACLGAPIALGIGVANAKTVEKVVELPVEVADIQGQVVSHRIKVTIFRDDARAHSPFLILNHGRSPHESVRIKPGRFRISEISRYFVAKGFAVFVPTRVGYGSTGGPDVENSGACRTKNYPPVYEAAARQSITVIEYAKTLPYIDPARGLVVGQSFGADGHTSFTSNPKSRKPSFEEFLRALDGR
jgi:dienelactone hydrolase